MNLMVWSCDNGNGGVQCVPVSNNGDNVDDDDNDDDDDEEDDGDDNDDDGDVDDNQPVCGVERVAGEERGEKRGNAHHHKRPSSLFIQLYSWLYCDDYASSSYK